MLRKSFLLFILIIATCVQGSRAGILDSIIRTPPLLSIEEADNIRKAFEDRKDEFCDLPGSIDYFYSDSTCYSPVQKRINEYLSEDDSSYFINDSINKVNYRIAMYTYYRFGASKDETKKRYSFSHSKFLEYLDEGPEIKEKTWVIKTLERMYNFIEKYILGPFYKLIAGPIAKLPFIWKTVLFLFSVVAFIFIVFIISRVAARFFPQQDIKAGSSTTQKGRTVATEINWLTKAEEECREDNLVKASDYLYKYLIRWSLAGNRIKRYEWWTNRQFLKVMQHRFPGDYRVAGNIINGYESVIYGHGDIEKKVLAGLIDRAGKLEGKRVR